MTTFRSSADNSKASRRRMLVVRTVFAGLVLLVVLVVARLLIVRSFDSGPLPRPLKELAGLPVTLPDGRASTLGTLVKPGLPTVISVWASWCGPCRKEAPTLVELRQSYGANKLNFLYLNGREPDVTREELDNFVSGIGLDRNAYAVLDAATLTKLTNDTANLIPRTYVFDRTGTPSAMIVGYKPLALARIEGLVK